MIRAILLFPVFILSVYGIGEWLRSILTGDEPFSAGRIGRAIGSGILAHGILMTTLGFAGLLTPLIAAIVSILPFFIFYKFWLRDLKILFTRTTWKSSAGFTFVEITFIAVIVVILLIRGFNALAPNISWDATSHHYLVAQIWLDHGRLSDLPSVIFSYYPSLTELGIAGTMALGTDYLSNLYGWLFGVLAIFLLVGIGIRHFNASEIPTGIFTGRFAGIAAALLFTLFPGVGIQTSGGYVDLPLACWLLLTLDCLLEFKTQKSWRTLIASAIFAGAMLSTKHLALIIYPATLITLVWIFLTWKTDKIPSRRLWGFIMAFIGISLLLPLPWYIRSTWFTGNPFYPFGIFGLPQPPHPPFTADSWVRPDYHRSFIGFLTYWLYLTFTSTVNDTLGRNYSLALPLLVPLAVMMPKLKPSGRLLAVLAGFSVLAIYAFFPVETRYHLPFIAAFALLFGILIAKWIIIPPERFTPIAFVFGFIISALYLSNGVVEYKVIAAWTINLSAAVVVLLFFRNSRKFRIVAISIFLLVLGIGSFIFDIQKDLAETRVRYKAVLNLEPEDRYLLRMSPRNYGMIHHINTRMDWQNMKILSLEPRLYRLKAQWVTWFGLEEPIVPTTPAENVAVWYRGGFTHIYLGDDVQAKALMFYNIVHKDGWDVPGATPQEMVEYLRLHPEEDKVYFLIQDLWFNFMGEPFERNRHFTHYWLPRSVSQTGFPTETVDGVEYYVASRTEILTTPEYEAQYAFVRGFRELVASGGLKIAYTDDLVYLFECDYPAYLKSHPEVDLESLGLL